MSFVLDLAGALVVGASWEEASESVTSLVTYRRFIRRRQRLRAT